MSFASITARPLNPKARAALAEKKREELERQEGTTRCDCGWSFEGPMIGGIHAARAHRAREHPERVVEKKRKKPWTDEEARSAAADARAEKEARRARVREAVERLAPPGGGVIPASDIAKEADVAAEGVGQTLRVLGYERAPRRFGRAHWIIPGVDGSLPSLAEPAPELEPFRIGDRRCRACGHEGELNDYRTNAASRFGRDNLCKRCHSAAASNAG